MVAEEKCEMEKIIKASWQNWEGDATEKITLRETKEGIFVESIISERRAREFYCTIYDCLQCFVACQKIRD